MKKLLILGVVAMLLATIFAGCAKPAEKPAQKPITIGLSFSDFTLERWVREAATMAELARKAGAQVIIQEANHDPKVQNDQIASMVTQGANVIIIVAEDGAAAATAVDEAAKAGVKCIAYDRLIKSPNLSAYISFDNVEVGRAEARGVLAVKDSGRFVLLGGSPTDNNAVLVRQGQMEVLKPYIDSGKIKIVADQWVPNWDQTEALKIMENILTATHNQIDAVVASNDSTALGAIEALRAQGLAGKVPISGQDATAAGCNAVAKGELTVTVFKDIRVLAPTAIDIAMKLAKGETPEGLTSHTLAELTGDKNLQGSVPCKFLNVVPVTKANLYDVIVKSGYQTYDDVYKGVPEKDRPPRP
jgi:D-xylose transport system substrate-binding protein